jgi:hypothetical protein
MTSFIEAGTSVPLSLSSWVQQQRSWPVHHAASSVSHGSSHTASLTGSRTASRTSTPPLPTIPSDLNDTHNCHLCWKAFATCYIVHISLHWGTHVCADCSEKPNTLIVYEHSRFLGALPSCGPVPDNLASMVQHDK